MNKFSFLRAALIAVSIAALSGCKSSKSTGNAESTAAPVNVTEHAEPGPAGGHSHGEHDQGADTSTPFPPSSGPADAELNFTKHKVQKGDTFYAIARKYGANVNDVMKANPGVDARALRIGQEILVPVSK